MSRQQTIRERLSAAIALDHLDVINESHMHSGPPNRETHFKVVLVSPDFDGKRAVQRHQAVYAVLGEELKNGLHALALHTYTPAEWAATGAAPASPACQHAPKE
jgi:stress-induced morphogen